MMQKGKGGPYGGGKAIVPRIRRLSWVQNLDDIDMEDRENFIVELYNRGRNEVGTMLLKQERRLSELTEEFENRADQQKIMDQNAYRNFLKKKLDELCQYLSANFKLALEEKNDLQEQKAMDSCIRIREVAFSAFQGHMRKVEYLMNEKPLEAQKTDSILFQLGQVQGDILKVVAKADNEQSEMKNMLAKRLIDAKNEETNRNRNVEQALNDLSSRLIQMQSQMQTERKSFEDAKFQMKEEKRNFEIDMERKITTIRTQVEANRYQDCSDSETGGLTTVEDFKKLATLREENKRSFADIMALHSKKAAEIKIGLGNIPPFLSRPRSRREFRENATHWRSLLGSEMREFPVANFSWAQ